MGSVTAAIGGVVVATLALLVSVVLPGFGVRRLARRPEASPPAEFALAVILSLAVATVVGGVLLAVHAFVPVVLAVALVALAVPGCPRALRSARALWRAEGAPLVAGTVVVVPTLVAATDPGWGPAQTYRWYYWQLGRMLGETHGVPSYVSEYGQRFRWLPDYLVFNVHSESYRALVPGTDAFAMQWWIAPVIAAFTIATYLVLRLWVDRLPATVGVFGVAATYWYAQKFNSYKPEALGCLLGLLAVWLVVQGLREGRFWWSIAAGVGLAMALNVHAIAATVFACLAVSAAVIEWAFGAPASRARGAVALVAAGVTAVFLASMIGLAFQGRLLVASDAGRPESTADSDATWVFLRRQAGDFTPSAPPDALTRLESNANRAWPGIAWDRPLGLGLAGVLTVGAALAAGLGDRRARLGLSVVFGFAGLLAGLILYFALAFDTFVPQNTGTARLVQYVPYAVALFSPFAAFGYLEATRRLGSLRASRIAGIALALAVGALAVRDVNEVARYRVLRITPPAQAALGYLRDHARPGEVVIANAGTRGTFEFFAPLENPLEGRQPLIEEPRLLRAANDSLADANAFFRSEPGSHVPFAGVGWVVMADNHRRFGAESSYGGTPATFTPNAQRLGFHAVWGREGVVVYRADPRPTTARWGPARALLAPTVLAALLSAGFFGLLVVLERRWFGQPRPQPVGQTVPGGSSTGPSAPRARSGSGE